MKGEKIELPIVHILDFINQNDIERFDCRPIFLR